jgi:PAS domain-containing protein
LDRLNHHSPEARDRSLRDALAQLEWLARESRRYFSYFENAPEAYLITDPRGRIREANQAAASLLNLCADELAGRPLSSFLAARPGRLASGGGIAQLLPASAPPMTVRFRRSDAGPGCLGWTLTHFATGARDEA